MTVYVGECTGRSQSADLKGRRNSVHPIPTSLMEPARENLLEDLTALSGAQRGPTRKLERVFYKGL